MKSLLCVCIFCATAQDRRQKSRREAIEHSQVVPVFEMFTVNIGPRLTASPAHKRAAEYARERLAAFGLENARLEPWHFGRGWTLEKLTIEMTEPRYLPLIGYADGWSPSTSGELTAAPVWVGGKSAEEITALSTKLKGAIVMSDPVMTNFVRRDRPQPSVIRNSISPCPRPTLPALARVVAAEDAEVPQPLRRLCGQLLQA